MRWSLALVPWLAVLCCPLAQGMISSNVVDPVVDDPGGYALDRWENATAENGTLSSLGGGGAYMGTSRFCVLSSDIGMHCTTTPSPQAPDETPTPPPAPDPPTAPDWLDEVVVRPLPEEPAPESPGTSDARTHAVSQEASADTRPDWSLRLAGAPAAGPAEAAPGPGQPGGAEPSLPSAEAPQPSPQGGDAGEPSSGSPRRAAFQGLLVTALVVAAPWALAMKALWLFGLGRPTGRRDASRALRETVAGLVGAEPGIRHAELVRRVGRGNGTVEHHVSRLLRSGQLQRVRVGGATCYFPAGRAPAPEDVRRVAVASPTARRVLAALQASPGLALVELAASVGVSLSTAHHHVRRLASAGLVRAVRDGRRTSLSLAGAGAGAAEAVAVAPRGLPLASPAPTAATA